MSIPLKWISPELTFITGDKSPMIVLAVTDLPDPDSPIMHRISPAWRSKEIFLTAWVRSIPGGRSTVRLRTDSTTSADVVGCDISSPCFVTLFALADASYVGNNMVDYVYYIVQ